MIVSALMVGGCCHRSAELTPAVKMPEWLKQVEAKQLGKPMLNDDDKLRFTIQLAVENVRNNTGGPFGAAVFEIKSGKLIAVGVNRVVPDKQTWAHAEMTAFARAQKRLNTIDLNGCVLVTSCEPCAMCFGATPWSGVSKMIYGAPGEFAREIGFDEGDKVPDWHKSLEKRKIQVIGPRLLKESREPFTLYRQKSGYMY